ncbi:hypothetical protein [Mucilaginibacter sp. FT3.2]|uniref:hypothetical protein n=1 Tax=Mucilaginibacter sp. FT3.2 TaxID=2723090 RepID=UPI0016222573|nr:hypothetical protein [Mucilaginibacter sp. FT3.2]MBB6233263.1 hypothetical protein [Mucilaginibacter sp. FT3.2]
MDPVMTLVIAAIVAAIILVMLNKQQVNKINNNMYADEVQQLYLLTAAEYKIRALENQQHNNLTGAETSNLSSSDIDHELAQLTAAFKRGDIRLNELNTKLDQLLNKFNVHSFELTEAY